MKISCVQVGKHDFLRVHGKQTIKPIAIPHGMEPISRDEKSVPEFSQFECRAARMLFANFGNVERVRVVAA